MNVRGRKDGALAKAYEWNEHTGILHFIAQTNQSVQTVIKEGNREGDGEDEGQYQVVGLVHSEDRVPRMVSYNTGQKRLLLNAAYNKD